jgi:hypothetical protein
MEAPHKLESARSFYSLTYSLFPVLFTFSLIHFFTAFLFTVH